MSRYLSAKEACDRLNIKEATLYAYVSRGLIRSESLDSSTRQRRYLTEDVDRLAQRQEQRRDPAKVVEEALHWGVPLLDSAITLIADHRLYYRGYDVSELAQRQAFETVAALIWTGQLQPLSAEPPVTSAPMAGLSFMASMQVALATAHDLAAFDLTAANLARVGGRILRLLLGALIPLNDVALPIADSLAAAWSPGQARLFNAALIVCADHELNASSFAARIAASAEAHPYAVVQAGLATLQGFRHGGHTERVSAFLPELVAHESVEKGISARLRRGEGIPGFGHPLYPDGDPRATILFDLLNESCANHPLLLRINAAAWQVFQLTGKAPTIDYALAALEAVLNLPEGAALALFALGRTAGWIGHAIEQYESGQLIRPRARYSGPPPQL